MKNPSTILISAPYMLPVIERFRPTLESAGCQLLIADVNERLEESDLLKYANRIDGTICGDDRYTRRVIEASPRLRVISKWGTGIDSIDQSACREFGVKVCNTLNAFTTPVADSVFAYMLSFARNTPWMDRQLKSGSWEKIAGRSLEECTLGIVGMGNIGQEVARRAKAFGMRVLGTDIRGVDRSPLDAFVTLDTLLAESDFVTLHTDLNAMSRHLMNASAFLQMKSSAVLINTSRGPVIDEAALAEALETGQIAGAALDVFEVEPLPRSSPLLRMDNVLLAPHNSNSSPAAWERVHQNTIKNLLDTLAATAAIRRAA